MLAVDASNDRTMLSHDVVKWDRRVRLEDIRRYVHHGVLREEDGWAREEEERNIGVCVSASGYEGGYCKARNTNC